MLHWIFKIEQYFDNYKVPCAQRLVMAAVNMEKEVVPWFQMTNRNHPFISWQAFTTTLEVQFGLSPHECHVLCCSN